jgi:hypothetical protein
MPIHITDHYTECRYAIERLAKLYHDLYGVKAIGRVLAERVARIAERLGNKRAGEWAEDPSFVMYLGVSWLNTPPVFRYAP